MKMAHCQGSFELNMLQNCSKSAPNRVILLVCAPILVEEFFFSFKKHTSNPYLSHYWSLSSSFSRHFCTFEGSKWLTMGSKRVYFTVFGHPKCLEMIFGTHFSPIFGPKRTPFFGHFEIFFGRAKHATIGSKCAKNICFGIRCGPESLLKKICTNWILWTCFGTHVFGLLLAA